MPHTALLKVASGWILRAGVPAAAVAGVTYWAVTPAENAINSTAAVAQRESVLQLELPEPPSGTTGSSPKVIFSAPAPAPT